MPFNLNKCKHLIITNKFSPSVYNYKLNDHTIQRAQAAKYLGSHSLSWTAHISGIIGRATSALAVFGGILVNLHVMKNQMLSDLYSSDY